MSTVCTKRSEKYKLHLLHGAIAENNNCFWSLFSRGQSHIVLKLLQVIPLVQVSMADITESYLHYRNLRVYT